MERIPGSLIAARELIDFLKAHLTPAELTEVNAILKRKYEAEHEERLDLLANYTWLETRTTDYKIRSETYLTLLLSIMKKCKPHEGGIDTEIRTLRRFHDEQKAPAVSMEEIRRQVEAKCKELEPPYGKPQTH
jgi:hypothetical protein